tara:strand:- start:1354 stop:1683 length:330 start_codon:yes stop_codon:yes gene_type:complete
VNNIHLLIDGTNVNADLDDETSWKNVFDRVVEATKTTKMRDFDLVRFPEQGVTAFLVLSESHVSVHTYPENNAYHFDVFSCKQFDVNDIIKILKDVFGSHEIDEKVYRR